jgi:hypothetical protein
LCKASFINCVINILKIILFNSRIWSSKSTGKRSGEFFYVIFSNLFQSNNSSYDNLFEQVFCFEDPLSKGQLVSQNSLDLSFCKLLKCNGFWSITDFIAIKKHYYLSIHFDPNEKLSKVYLKVQILQFGLYLMT